MNIHDAVTAYRDILVNSGMDKGTVDIKINELLKYHGSLGIPDSRISYSSGWIDWKVKESLLSEGISIMPQSPHKVTKTEYDH